MLNLINTRYSIPLVLGFVFSIVVFVYCYLFTSILSSNTWWLQIINVVLLYLAVVLLLLGAQKWQEIRSIRTGNVQHQINQLQLISSLNQLNPHFMFNALNTISSLIVQKDSQKAYRAMIILTKLMRSLLENSDKISSSILEEIKFVKNYLEIETIRFNKSFESDIFIDSSVKQELLIPKMIIQLHVENAVKHGLLPKNSGESILKININQKNNITMIVINDNGIGREASKNLRHDEPSTGKGIEISEKLIKLYNKLHKYQVNQSFDDIIGKEGQPAGTEVRISIKH